MMVYICTFLSKKLGFSSVFQKDVNGDSVFTSLLIIMDCRPQQSLEQWAWEGTSLFIQGSTLLVIAVCLRDILNGTVLMLPYPCVLRHLLSDI